jgi:YD repeat-containing protein
MLNQTVDLITGLPLVQVTDLELPMNGATFRLTRTRSGERLFQHWGPHDTTSRTTTPVSQHWWDWTGTSWMMGEAPLLFVDSALPDVVGFSGQGTGREEDSPKIWLALDAHHSIPFSRIEDTGQYEAPPRFRAVLRHNGVNWHVLNSPGSPWHGRRVWDVRPTEFRISLYEGALTYVFSVDYADMPSHESLDENDNLRVLPANERPILPSENDSDYPNFFRPPWSYQHSFYQQQFSRGIGIPYLGYLARVEDKYGHVVRLHYCHQTFRDVDDSSTETCVECAQNCVQKGRISHITLEQDQTVLWTLLYAYRLVDNQDLPHHWINSEDFSEEAFAELQTYGTSPVVDRIYAFPGTVAALSSNSTPCLTLSTLTDAGYGSTADPIADYNAAHASAPISEEWQHVVRYYYQTYYNSLTERHHVYPEPMLIATDTISRASPTAFAHHNWRVFWYQGGVAGATHADGSIPFTAAHGLSAIFEDSDIRALNAARESIHGSAPGPISPQRLADTGYRKPDTTTYNGLGFQDHIWTETVRAKAQSYASVWMTPAASWNDESGTVGIWDWNASYSSLSSAPPPGPLVEHFVDSVDKRKLVSDGHCPLVGFSMLKDEKGIKRYYRINRLRVLPENRPLPTGDPDFAFHLRASSHGQGPYKEGDYTYSAQHEPDRSVFFMPYRWHSYQFTNLPDIGHLWNGFPDLQQPRWISIIDEFKDAASARQPNYDSVTAYGIGQLARRVVNVNASGVILSERSWDLRGSEPILTQKGISEKYVYKTVQELVDTPGALAWTGSPVASSAIPSIVKRELVLTEVRSLGWSVADQLVPSQGASDGLVRFTKFGMFGTSANDWSARLQVESEGIQRGTGGGELVTKQYFRSATHPEQVSTAIDFFSPQTRLTTEPTLPSGSSISISPSRSVQHFGSTYDTTSSNPIEQRRTSTKVVGVPRQQRPGGDWYFPVECEYYTESGNVEWAVKALVKDPSNLASGVGDDLAQVVFTHYSYNELGQTLAFVADAEAGETIHGVTIPETYPGGLSRVGSTPALNYVTRYEYDVERLTDVIFPGGRRWASRVVGAMVNGEEGNVEYVMSDLVQVAGEGTAQFRSYSQGEVLFRMGKEPTGAPVFSLKVRYRGLLNLSELPQTDINTGDPIPEEAFFEEVARAEMKYDVNGRLQEALLLEPVLDSNGVPIAFAELARKEVNELVDVRRERERDGTITRITRDLLGRVRRTYQGTWDEDWASSPAVHADYNMVLLERQDYGSGINDAWLPTLHYKYEANPSFNLDYYGQVDGEDTQGQITQTKYDWRMRPVRMDTYAKGELPGSDPISTTLTYLDHADRPVLEARYAGTGAGDLDVIDPSLLMDEDGLYGGVSKPDCRAFFEGGLRPLSLSETIYGVNGAVVERRTYDVAWNAPSGSPTAQPPCQAERYGYGVDGKQVYAQRPGSPIQVSRLDGVGRIAETASVLPLDSEHEYELSRTDFAYDADGNVVETASWERFVDATNLASATSGESRLDTNNAVRTRSISWYNPQKRLIATADLGTEQAGYVAGASSYVRLEPIANATSVPSFNADTGVRTIPSALAAARVTINHYDDTGNLVLVSLPDGTVTKNTHNKRGEITHITENEFAAGADQKRTTAYERMYGRLIKVSSPKSAATADMSNPQQTIVRYGADVVEWGIDPENEDPVLRAVSRNNAYVGRAYLPDLNGASNNAPDYWFRYYFDGSLAERVDARGIAVRYVYDDHGRVSSAEVGRYESVAAAPIDTWQAPSPDSWIAGYPDGMTPPSGVPADRSGFIEFAYNERLNIERITARTANTSARTALTDNQFEYDDRGNIGREWQSYGAFKGVNTPRITYTWDYQATAAIGDADERTRIGYSRLTEMQYPTHIVDSGENGGRVVGIGFGAASATNPNHLLSRPTALTNDSATIASFGYSGSGRRSSMIYGPVSQNYRLASETGLAGLDKFGRPIDLHFKSTASGNATFFRSESTYDLMGNRVSSNLTQQSSSYAPVTDVWATLNSYDGLNRLTGTEYGKLINSGGVLSIVDPGVSIQKRIDRWNLDLLGNWSAQPNGSNVGDATVGRYTLNGDGAGGVAGFLHAVDNRNQIASFIKSDGATTTSAFVYDLAGNLVFDGMYFYQYDAWNRLLQVNEKGSLTAGMFDGAGNLPNEGTGAVDPEDIGPVLKHHAYDGLGRLVRTASPIPGGTTPTGGAAIVTERYYYDGIRRVQEVMTNPLSNMENMAFAQQSGLGGVLNEIVSEQNAAAGGGVSGVDGNIAALGYEQAQMELGQSYSMGGEGGGEEEIPTVGTTLAREYVWGPGDRGTDELLVQFDTTNKPWYVIQDGGGDVSAVVQPAVTSGGSSPARVVAQYVYDPYGAAISVEHLFAHPFIHAGHKGLFIERLDQPALDASTLAEIPRLVPLATNYVHMRNRAYAPGLGRFLQRDMNATGSSLNSFQAYHGAGAFPVIMAMDMNAMYGNGLNLYQYLGSNPWLRHDPMGLSYDPFAMIVDDYIATDVGSKAAMFERLLGGARTATYVGLTVMSMLPFPIAGIAADLGADFLEGNMPPELIAARKAMGAIALGALAVTVGKIGYNAAKYAVGYVQKYGMRGAVKNLYAGGKSLAGKAYDWLQRKKSVPGTCGCFTAGTLVWSAMGPMPIEEIKKHDWVYAHNVETGVTELREVTAIIVTPNSAGLDLVISHLDGEIETISTTDEHPFWIEADSCRGAKGEWKRADTLREADAVRTLKGVAIVERILFGAHRETVYNFTVEGLNNYRVGASGVLVHNQKCEWPRASTVKSVSDLPPDFRKWSPEYNEQTGALIFRDPENVGRTVRYMPSINPNTKTVHPEKVDPTGYVVYSDGYGGSTHLPGSIY